MSLDLSQLLTSAIGLFDARDSIEEVAEGIFDELHSTTFSLIAPYKCRMVRLSQNRVIHCALGPCCGGLACVLTLLNTVPKLLVIEYYVGSIQYFLHVVELY